MRLPKEIIDKMVANGLVVHDVAVNKGLIARSTIRPSTVGNPTPSSTVASRAGNSTVGNHDELSWYLFIPAWRPPSLNELLAMHWAKRGRIKKAAYELVGMLAMLAGIPKALGKRAVRLDIRLDKGMKRYDDDNAKKVILDALVKNGLLKNDSPTWLRDDGITWSRGSDWGTAIYLADL